MGLWINLGKSEIVPVGEVWNIDELPSNLGCHVASLKFLSLKALYDWTSNSHAFLEFLDTLNFC